jgi:hypothetical protein
MVESKIVDFFMPFWKKLLQTSMLVSVVMISIFSASEILKVLILLETLSSIDTFSGWKSTILEGTASLNEKIEADLTLGLD